MTGYLHVIDFIYKIVSVFDVTGVEFGEWVNEMIYIFCNPISFLTAVTDNGMANRDHRRDRPHPRRLVNLGEEVEEAKPGFIWTVQILFLFCSDKFFIVETLCDIPN